jgi:2'-aminobiphenyl-2,3-diol 1,2-dioxygenase, large subunit
LSKIVAAYATSHILFSPEAVPNKAARVVAGMEALGHRAREARPDVILMIVSDHMFNLNTSVQPPFCVGVADDYVGFGDMGIPPRSFKGHRDFAEAMVRHTARRGFDLAKAEELLPDHGITLPLLFIRPWGKIPVVPLYVNINMDPVPSPARCYALAGVIREFIEEERPTAERVAVVGSGGLSHWLNIPGAGRVAEDYDRQVLSLISAGRAEELAKLSVEQICENAGNGGLEIMNWMMMAATVPGRRGETIYYEAIPEWFTGMGGIAMAI